MSTKSGQDNFVLGSKLTSKILKKKSFGGFLKDIRTADEVTQTELAKRLSVSRQYINAIESDRQEVGLDTAARLGEALGYGPLVFLEVLFRTQLERSGIKATVELKAV